MNGYINAKTNTKKLQFGETKCHKMHVGLKNETCPDLYVDTWKLGNEDEIVTAFDKLVDQETGESLLNKTESEKYLGDIVSCDGKNTKNILARRAKGVGIVDQVNKILEGTVYGPFIFEVAIILRQSLFINGVLNNAECWYGVKESELDQLEQVDEMLLRKLLEVGQGCPKEMLFLETGLWPLRYIVMSRRLMFLHYILNEDKNSLIYRFLQAQIKNPVKDDWILTVMENLEELDIYLDLEVMASLSTDCCKKFIYEKIEKRVLCYLNEIKLQHTKVMHIKHEQLELQSYFMPQNQINVQLTKFIFHAKTRMLKVRHNFKNMFRDLSCPLGCGGDDTQEHILTCTKIVETSVTDGTQIKYEDLFSDNILKQTACATILQRRYNIRKGMV